MTPAIHGTRSAVTCRATSDFLLPYTRTSQTPFMLCRSRAIQNIIRRKESYASIVAAQAETSGRRLRKDCRKAIAMSTSCAVHWPLTHTIRAGFTSAPQADRFMPQPIQAIAGSPSFAIFPQCYRSKFRHCYDTRRIAATSADVGAG